MEITFDSSGLALIASDLDATEAQVSAALRSTLPKVATWLKARSIKGLSKELDLQQKILRRRLKSMRMRSAPDGSSIQIWYGLDPVAMIYLIPKGSRKPPGRAPAGSFVAGNGDARQVFKRRGNGRLPIDKQTLDISRKAEAWLEDRLIGADEFGQKFFSTFEHELTWRMRTPR